jgi:hypothetical protein
MGRWLTRVAEMRATGALVAPRGESTRLEDNGPSRHAHTPVGASSIATFDDTSGKNDQTTKVEPSAGDGRPALWYRLAAGEVHPPTPVAIESLPVQVGDLVEVIRPAGHYKRPGDRKPRNHPERRITSEPVGVEVVRPCAYPEPFAVVSTGYAYPVCWMRLVAGEVTS